MGSLGGWEILIILVVLVLLFGAKRLPDMARSMGQSARVLKGEMKGFQDDSRRDEAEPTVPPTPAAPVQRVESRPVRTGHGLNGSTGQRRTETPGVAEQ